MNAYRFEDLQPGMGHSFEVLVTGEMMDSFLRVSGDENPLHRDDAYAAALGYPGKVVYGMLTASFYSTLVGVYLPGKYCLLQGMNVSFHHPVFVEDVLSVSGEVSYLNETYRHVEVKARVKRGEKTISRAKIKLGFHGQ